MPTYKNTGLEYIPNLTDINNNKVNLAPGLEIQSYKLYDIINLVKIADTPYYPLTKLNETLTSPTSITNLKDIGTIRIIPLDSNIYVTANNVDNPSKLYLMVNQPIDISNDNEINTLYFTGAGKVVVIGL